MAKRRLRDKCLLDNRLEEIGSTESLRQVSRFGTRIAGKPAEQGRALTDKR